MPHPTKTQAERAPWNNSNGPRSSPRATPARRSILHFILPFVVIAIKGRLDRLIELVSVNNEIMLEANRLPDNLASEVESSLKN